MKTLPLSLVLIALSLAMSASRLYGDDSVTVYPKLTQFVEETTAQVQSGLNQSNEMSIDVNRKFAFKRLYLRIQAYAALDITVANVQITPEVMLAFQKEKATP